MHDVAVHHAGVGVHQVQAHRAGIGEGIVEVGGGADMIAIAAFDRRGIAVLQERRLGDGVDGAAGGAAAEHQAGRALQHLHFLIIEAVAGIGAEIAQAVEIDVVLGVEAADLELVAGQGAAFADGDGDARHIAQRIAQGGGAPAASWSAASMTLTAWGVSWRLVEGMDASGGLWLSPFLSAWSLTETGPSCTGWAAAGAASSSAPSEAPDSARVLKRLKSRHARTPSRFSVFDLAGILGGLLA